MARTCEFASCGNSLAGKSSRAKFCSTLCRVKSDQAARRRAAGVPERKAKVSAPATAKTERKQAQDDQETASAGLVIATKAELEKHPGALESFAGQLALSLASRMASPSETGISSLSKELRTVMAEALAGRPAGQDGEPPPEDEVERARRARERKASQAAG